jgi:hypothetical protein
MPRTDKEKTFSHSRTQPELFSFTLLCVEQLIIFHVSVDSCGKGLLLYFIIKHIC